jgi:hypothetical protein
MTDTSDLYHFFGSDCVAANNGDLQTVSGASKTQQRILRRLLTTQGQYIFHPNYGGSLAKFVGKLADFKKIKAVIKGQLLLENAVALSPAPVITVTQSPSDPTAITVQITYTDAPTGQPQVLSFSVKQ